MQEKDRDNPGIEEILNEKEGINPPKGVFVNARFKSN